MIFPHIVNLSLLIRAVVSWGIMWPLIGKNKGDWYLHSLPDSSMKILNSYKAFISIALILGDGLYNFVKILYITSMSVHKRFKNKSLNPVSDKKVTTTIVERAAIEEASTIEEALAIEEAAVIEDPAAMIEEVAAI
ncbi:unnamed protein product [Lactuca saligna]|uniref:Uncharacterized protein n=1 Tax=Lactuca saligna TaxID=75948 RepID=A0AA36E825_LACSI|nr:unnamed protein product [Lactuca saligna]